MALRRYGNKKSQPYSSTAGAQRQPESAPAEQRPLNTEPQPPQQAAPDQTDAAAKPDNGAEHFSTGLKDQLSAMRQPPPQPDPLDQYIGYYFPTALAHERQWLRERQHYLSDPNLVHAAAGIALQRGVPRESPEFLREIGRLIDQHHAAMQAPLAPAPQQPTPEPAPAMTHIDFEQSDGQSDSEPEPHAVSAPVSRDHGAYAGALGPVPIRA